MEQNNAMLSLLNEEKINEDDRTSRIEKCPNNA